MSCFNRKVNMVQCDSPMCGWNDEFGYYPTYPDYEMREVYDGNKRYRLCPECYKIWLIAVSRRAEK